MGGQGGAEKLDGRVQAEAQSCRGQAFTLENSIVDWVARPFGFTVPDPDGSAPGWQDEGQAWQHARRVEQDRLHCAHSANCSECILDVSTDKDVVREDA